MAPIRGTIPIAIRLSAVFRYAMDVGLRRLLGNAGWRGAVDDPSIGLSLALLYIYQYFTGVTPNHS